MRIIANFHECLSKVFFNYGFDKLFLLIHFEQNRIEIQHDYEMINNKYLFIYLFILINFGNQMPIYSQIINVKNVNISWSF